MLSETTINLPYSFDDEVVVKFCYYNECKRIELHYNLYYDQIKGERIEHPCFFLIENWKEAKVKSSPEDEDLGILEKNIPVIRMIYYIKYENNNLFMFVNTSDDKYLDLFFEDPKLSLINVIV
jgi:hypothetical protein